MCFFSVGTVCACLCLYVEDYLLQYRDSVFYGLPLVLERVELECALLAFQKVFVVT